MHVRDLREEAQKYRRLANSIYNATMAAELEARARTLEDRAAKLEAATPSPRPRDTSSS